MPDEGHDQVRLSLLSNALNEANTAVRAYDTKAQIAAVGYIFSLGVAGQILNYIERDVTLNGMKVIAVWILFMVPILQFGKVLYPTRGALKTSWPSVLFARKPDEIDPEAFIKAAHDCDPFNEVSRELLRVSKVRETKRKRFIAGMVLTMTAYAALFGYQVVAAYLASRF